MTSPNLSSSEKINGCLKNQVKNKNSASTYFPEHISLEEVNEGLAQRKLVKGYIRINDKKPSEAYVDNEDSSKPDYFISSLLDRNKAFHGDEVILKIKQINDNKKIKAEVVYITQKIHPRVAVGFLQPLSGNKNYDLFTPRDKKIPLVYVPKVCWPRGFDSNPDFYKNILINVKINKWTKVKSALGKITEILGICGDLKIESLAILREFCLDPLTYTHIYRNFLPMVFHISQRESLYREDIRRECIFTIDNPTSIDLDDAISCKKLPSGNYVIGAHIADVSHYLKENTPLDKLAKEKAISTYTAGTNYHMLPAELCWQCSLLPGHDRLTFSVFWEITSDGKILNKRFAKTIINSCSKLTYNDAQMLIDTHEENLNKMNLCFYNGHTVREVSEAIKTLNTVASHLRNQRKQNGAINFNRIKISFLLDYLTREPIKILKDQNTPAHQLIEELMILANVTVAEWNYKAFPDLALLRIHDAPNIRMLNELRKKLELVGVYIDISSAGGIQSSLDKYEGSDPLGLARKIVLNRLLIKSLKIKEKYICASDPHNKKNINHFTLAVPVYTHFTSPIRRYADIVTHRLLAASLNYGNKPQWTSKEISELAENCNRKNIQAKLIERVTSDLYLCHFIEKCKLYVEYGAILDIREQSFDIITFNTGSIVRIYTNDFENNIIWKSEEIKDEKESTISKDSEFLKNIWRIHVTFPKTNLEPEVKLVLEMFAWVRVQLTRKPKTNVLEAKLLRPI